ncbi:SDR family oxidoreductase [Lentzea sp. NPDC060358]|uniref:SDR family oxidoreductase n=1 Tax=Lentzea sp. NPDC060358 TaxID=3347103 RepID=UPI0036492401
MKERAPTALITGAAGLLGAELVERFRANGFTTLGLDIAGDVDLVVDLAAGELDDERLHDIDVVVSNAAVLTTVSRADRMTQAQWDKDIAVNLSGAFRVVRACLPGMVSRGHGRVIAVSSTAAALGLNRQVAYAASKAGLIGMIKTIALENAANGITANAVLPGVIGNGSTTLPPELEAVIPIGRPGRAREIADVIAFLASPAAGYLTGQTITVDGGLSLSPAALAAPEPPTHTRSGHRDTHEEA